MRTPSINRINSGLIGIWRRGYAVLSYLLLSLLPLSAQVNPNPTVALRAQTATVTENAGSTVVIEIKISAAQENPQVFGILLRGQNVIREDFVNQPNNIEIGAGKTIGTVTITINDDNLIEGTEQVTGSINNLPPGIDRAAESETTFKIEDNDFASIQLSSSQTVMPEGSQPIQFSINLDTGPKELRQDLVIDLSFDPTGTAIGAFGDATTPLIPNQDFRVFPNQITFQAGAQNGDQRNVEVTFLSDTNIEGDEQATLLMKSASATAASTLQTSHLLKISDQNTPIVRFTTTETIVGEGAPQQSIGLQLDLGNNQLTIPLTFELFPGQNDSAIGNFPANNNQPQDFQFSSLNLTFQAGSPNNSQGNFQLSALDDQLVEGDEFANLSVLLNNNGFPQFSPPATHSLKIQDANQATVQFEVGRSEVLEGDAAINLNAVLETGGASLAGPLTFSVRNGNNSVAIGRFGPGANQVNADFDLAQNVFTFSTGDVNQTVRSISITSVADLLVEGTEQANLVLLHLTGPAVTGTRAQHKYIIADANRATLNFATTDIILNEGIQDQTINLTLNTAGSSLAVPVGLEIRDNGNSTAIGDINSPPAPAEFKPAAINADYSINNPLVVFPIGSNDNATQGFQVSTLIDQLIEGEEIGNLGIAKIVGPAALGAATSFSLKIADQNQASVAFQSSSSTTSEATAPTHSITVQIDTGGAILERPFSTPFSLSHQSTSANSDLTTPAPLTIDWPALTENRNTKTINIPIIDDSLLEPTESFELQLQPPSSPMGITGNSTHIVSIEDNDTATIGLSPHQDTGSEDGTPIQVAIVLSQVSSVDTEVLIALSGTAVPTGSELVRIIPAGKTTFEMVLFVVDDEIVEGPESLTLTLSTIRSGDPDIRIDTQNQAKTITVVDNDVTDVTIIKQADATEDQQAGEFTLNFSKAVNRPLNFDLSLAGTATGNADYTTPQLQLTMPANQTSLSIPIPVLADNIDEPTETILASLQGNNLPILPITIQNGTTEMQVIDDDATPVANPDGGIDYTLTEDDSLAKTAINGILSNDTDTDDGNGSPNLSARIDGPPPANARTFSLQSDGSFTYVPNPNFNGTDTFQYRASDATNESTPALVTITITPVNDAPIHHLPPSQTIIEGSNLAFTLANQNLISISDPDLGNNAIAVSLSTTGSLSLGSTAGLQFSTGNGTSNPSMAFTGTLIDVNRALNGLTYQPPPGTGAHTITFVTNDQGSTGSGGAQETTSVIPITIRPINTPPLLTLLATGTLSISGGGSIENVAPGLVVSDAENANLASASIAISANYSPNQDVLSFFNLPTGMIGSFNSNSGVLILQGPAPTGDFQQALRQIGFSNTSSTPDTSTREVTITVNDGAAQSNAVTRNIGVSIPQFPPTISSLQSSSRTYTENGLPASLLSNVTVAQGSAGALTGATVTIGSGFAAGEDVLRAGTPQGLSANFDSTQGTLHISGTASSSAYASALESVVYSNNSNSPSTSKRSISFSVSDSDRSSRSIEVSLSVVSVNDSPRIQSPIAPPIEFRQGETSLNVFASISLFDPDHTQLGAATAIIDKRFDSNQDQLTVSLLPNGIRTSGFDKATGSLTLEGTAPIDAYESAILSITYLNETSFADDRSPSISLAVADPEGATSNSISQQINLIGKSTPPVISGLENLTFPEDSKTIAIDFEVNDDRTQSDEIKLEFNVAEAETLFTEDGISLTRANGGATLTLKPLPNIFGETEIKIAATDQQALSSDVTFLLTIEEVNDPAVVSISPMTPLIFQDGSGPRPLFDEVNIIDPDKKELIGATLSFTDGYQPHQDLLSVQAPASIASSYDVSSGTLKLSGKALPKVYAETIRNIRYQNLSHRPTETLRSLTLIVQDTPESSSKPIDLGVKVLDNNLPPIGKSDQFSTQGKETITISFAELLKNDSDPDNDDITISLFNSQTQQGAPILVQSDSVRIRSPKEGSTDKFYYTLTDKNGGYSAVQVTLIP